VPIVGAIGVWMMHDWFGVAWYHGALAIPLIILLTLIAVNATGLTSIDADRLDLEDHAVHLRRRSNRKQPGAPTSSPRVMTSEVASNASNLLMDIKPGYMLGAKPRQQAIGHCIGIIAGAMASTPLFFVLFMMGRDMDKPLAESLVTEKFSFTAAVQWKGISDFITQTFSGSGASIMHHSAQSAMIAAAIFGVVFEVVRTLSKGKLPISPLALGLGFVIPPDSTFWMFLGSLFFWVMGKMYAKAKESGGYKLWVDSSEAICAGLIAGAALTGIGDQLINVLILPLFGK
jgi:uncharacterized oligopeptide transporter (OPT) family protein